MTILIIGSRGFIGSACLRHFSAQHSVITADIVPDNCSTDHFEISKAADYNRLFSDRRPDLVINASGAANVGQSFSDPEKDRQLNVLNVDNILNSIALSGLKCKFINFSSAAVYGNPDSLPVKENARLNPLSPYGAHKLESEGLLRNYWTKHGISACSLRIFSAYGPGLRKQLFWDLYHKAMQNNVVTLAGTGAESRDFIFIDDLVHAIDLIATRAPMKGEAINVATGEEVTIRAAAEIFLRQMGMGHRLEFNGKVREGDPMNWRADITLLKEWGFESATTIELGLHKYLKWVKSNV
ncbi:MAG: NAD-dependent epimerase/dehydratase family protein [Bacteroidia bacterium]|nr:NAD-dependent epimerase/dehydratase family protein [Bacteroidia bacterium]